MLASALNSFCNCISLEKDEAQVNFIKMRINGIWECPDADHEVGSKHVGDTERVQTASLEPMPPSVDEAGELGDLNHGLIIGPTQPSKDAANDDSLNQDDDEGLNVEKDIQDLALL